MKLHEKILQARIKSGLSQKEVAEKLHLAPATISSYEKEDSALSACQLIKLARILNISLDELTKDVDIDF